MISRWLVLVLLLCASVISAQMLKPHAQAHAHNDYEHPRPLLDAWHHGFGSVEADVHGHKGKLLVSHAKPGRKAKTLEELYLRPLDSLLLIHSGQVYAGYPETFYLMIDFKTAAAETLSALRKSLEQYPALLCSAKACPVKVFISGNRPVKQLVEDGFEGLALDGRPDDLGKGFTAYQMPVVSDRYANWSSWSGKRDPEPADLERIRALASRVHAEGKKLRLWAIPDQELVWEALLEAGVDLLNTDRLGALHQFLLSRGN